MAPPKIVKPSFHNLRHALDLDFFNIRRVNRESTLDSFAKGYAADCEGFLDAATFSGNHNARENLGSLLISLTNFV